MMKKLLLLCISLYGLCATSAQPTIGYMPPPIPFNHYKISTLRGTLPSSYDARKDGILLAPRNQVISGTCWAFAALDAVQAYFYKNGYQEGYLSPELLSTCHEGFVWNKKSGGNSYMAAACFSRLEGPALETAIPYNPQNMDCPVHSATDYPAYTLGFRILPEYSANEVKQAILDYGSVTAAMYYDRSYYNAATNTYEFTGCSGENPPACNHAVSLVGWDDDKEIFLAKFTAGTQAFDDGYMYISYSDCYILSDCAAFSTRVEKTAVKHGYLYDRTGMIGSFDSGIATTALSSFYPTAKEKLSYMGFYVATSGETIGVTALKNSNDQWSTLTKTYEVTCPYPGFYAVQVEEDVTVQDSFMVAVDYPTEVPIEDQVSGYNTPIIQHSGKQYLQFEGASTLYPIGSDVPGCNFNLCVRAYTMDIPSPTSTQNAKEHGLLPIVIDGQLNPNLYGQYVELRIYSESGQLLQVLHPGEKLRVHGRVVIYLRGTDGHTQVEKAILH